VSRHSNRYAKICNDPAEIARRLMEQMEAAGRKRAAEAAAVRDPAQWGIDGEIGQLDAEMSKVDRDVAKRITRAKRWDVFALLRNAGSLTGDHIICIDKLHRLMAIRVHTAGAANPGTPIDGLTAKDYPRAQVEAGVKVDGLLAHIEAQERVLRQAQRSTAQTYRARLLVALSAPTIVEGRAVSNWRKTVETITGEFRDARQSKMVVEVCDALEQAVADRADDAAWKAFTERREAELAAA
jgi:hypothetical protein